VTPQYLEGSEDLKGSSSSDNIKAGNTDPEYVIEKIV
jgi:hypothetical protein